ncbi:MAG: D-alanyl-D-alanine carboxypeptidase [Lachnospiraceae bacterium]|nr:D-alanyl-D-alanine carboxypeptidase [Lachnospiraceae bacterium]
MNIRKIMAYVMLVVVLCTGMGSSAMAAELLQMELTSPSAILMEASTGTVLFEKNPDEIRSPASITKIMTMLLTFEAIEQGRVQLTDEVTTSAYAKSMGGSQVFLEEGEVQTLDTLLKCIAIASGNDASVAVAEFIAGSENEFVNMMNEKAQELGMTNTHFLDCCGLSSDENHHTTARDVAIMSRELITKYPQVYEYTQIWMEDITHVTRKGSSTFTLSSTNKLLKQYEWTTGLKTGSTDAAKYCFSATANKDGIDLIAVIMGAPDFRVRFSEAQSLLEYGFSRARIYTDIPTESLEPIAVRGGKEITVAIAPQGEFRYLDTEGLDFSLIEKVYEFEEELMAPIVEGQEAGVLHYMVQGEEIGNVPLVTLVAVEKAGYLDYLQRLFEKLLL